MKYVFQRIAFLVAGSLVLGGCFDNPPPVDPNNPPITTNVNTGNPYPTNVARELKRKWKLLLPRQQDALFVSGSTAYACTKEGSLYGTELKKVRYTITAIDLNSGKKMWNLEGTNCSLQTRGKELLSSRFVADKQIAVDVLDAATGRIHRTIKVEHTAGCETTRLSGPGERMFANQPFHAYPCYQSTVASNRWVFTNKNSVQIYDIDTGKRLYQKDTDDTVKRIVAATVSGDMVYTLYGTEKLTEGAIAIPGTPSSKTGLSYQLKASSLTNGALAWNAGPLYGPVKQALLEVKDGALLVQVMQSTKEFSEAPKPQTPPKKYTKPSSWNAHMSVLSLNSKTGSSNWNKPYQQTFTSFNEEAPGLLPTTQDGDLLFAQIPGKVNAIHKATGTLSWSVGVPGLKLANSSRSYQSQVILPTAQIMNLAPGYLHVRGHLGVMTLVDFTGPTPMDLRGINMMYASSPTTAPTATEAKPKPATQKPPKQVVTSKGYCNTMSSTVPMSQISPENRFFLPRGNTYYGPNRFFDRFCTNYHVDFTAHVFNPKDQTAKKKPVWTTRVYVPEAPVFTFMRSNQLFVLSDNGDWYTFTIQ